MFRFHAMVSLDHPGMWRVVDSQAVYGDSRAMPGGEAVVTCQWLNEAHLDGRLRTPWSEFNLGDWEAEQ